MAKVFTTARPTNTTSNEILVNREFIRMIIFDCVIIEKKSTDLTWTSGKSHPFRGGLKARHGLRAISYGELSLAPKTRKAAMLGKQKPWRRSKKSQSSINIEIVWYPSSKKQCSPSQKSKSIVFSSIPLRALIEISFSMVFCCSSACFCTVSRILFVLRFLWPLQPSPSQKTSSHPVAHTHLDKTSRCIDRWPNPSSPVEWDV